MSMSNSALDVQVGGDHYKQLKIQPIEYTMKNGLDFIQGNIIKYATRFKNKDGVKDLEKVKHYADLAIEMHYPDTVKTKARSINIDSSTERGAWVMHLAEMVMRSEHIALQDVISMTHYVEKQEKRFQEKKNINS
jgi:hypothetical protein